jgi:hypothetical protein
MQLRILQRLRADQLLTATPVLKRRRNKDRTARPGEGLDLLQRARVACLTIARGGG